MRAFVLQRPRAAVVFVFMLLVGLVLTEQRNHLLERVWFNWQVMVQPATAPSFGLHDYRVTIEAKPLAGIASDVSALTFDPDRRSLFTVTNKHQELIELSLSGDVLRRIPLVGFGDAEAVEYIGPGHYVITDEYQQRLISVHVRDDTVMLDADQCDQLRIGVGPNSNNGFEGLAYDAVGKRLFIAKERRPARILEVQGFPFDRTGGPQRMDIRMDPATNERLFVRDLSSLLFDARSGHLLALSDESQQIVELSEAGHPVDNVSLGWGSLGLAHGIPQPEGLAMDDRNGLYVVSEPNLFYAFRKP